MAEQTKKQIEKQQQETLRKFMSSPLDFSDFTLDAGDGVSWNFSPDPMPADTARLSAAMNAISESSTAEDSTPETVEAAYAELVDAIRSRITDEKQKKEFPLPRYGSNALMWFAMHLATGRDGFPTE